jgi:hypothetical protein
MVLTPLLCICRSALALLLFNYTTNTGICQQKIEKILHKIQDFFLLFFVYIDERHALPLYHAKVPTAFVNMHKRGGVLGLWLCRMHKRARPGFFVP